MYQRYRNFALYKPFEYFMMNALVFCIIAYLYGVYLLNQDPEGTMLFVFFGMWMLCGGCLASLYRLARLDDWLADSPYTAKQLRDFKWRASGLIEYITKDAAWDDYVHLAKDYRRAHSDIDPAYAQLAVIWAQENRAGDKCLCKEAEAYTRSHPTAWNIIKHA